MALPRSSAPLTAGIAEERACTSPAEIQSNSSSGNLCRALGELGFVDDALEGFGRAFDAVLVIAAFGWQQEGITENAKKISDTGRELHGRLARFVEHLDKAGRNLTSASSAFNQAIGTLESRVMPSARKLRELSHGSEQDIQAPAIVEVLVRPVATQALDLLGEEITHADQ